MNQISIYLNAVLALRIRLAGELVHDRVNRKNRLIASGHSALKALSVLTAFSDLQGKAAEVETDGTVYAWSV